MTHECISAELVDELLHRSADDRVRKDAESCPRCSSLLRSYEEFMDADSASAFENEARTLVEFLGAEEWARPPSRIPRPRRSSQVAAVVAALATAAALAIAIPRLFESAPSSGIERGAETPSLEILHAQREADELVISWDRVVQAEDYFFVAYGEDLSEIGRRSLEDAETARIRLQEFSSAGNTLAWRIVAERGGEAVGQSQLRTLTLR